MTSNKQLSIRKKSRGSLNKFCNKVLERTLKKKILTRTKISLNNLKNKFEKTGYKDINDRMNNCNNNRNNNNDQSSCFERLFFLNYINI